MEPIPWDCEEEEALEEYARAVLSGKDSATLCQLVMRTHQLELMRRFMRYGGQADLTDLKHWMEIVKVHKS